MWLLHVYGSPYEMGFAHGFLLKDQVKKILEAGLDSAERSIEQVHLPLCVDGMSVPTLYDTRMLKSFYQIGLLACLPKAGFGWP